MDEVADLVSQLPGSNKPADPVVSEAVAEPAVDVAPAAEPAKKKRRTSRRKRQPVAKELTMEELDKQQLLPPETPKPTEKVRGLGDLYAKYRIGDDPTFRVHVYRLFPKVAPGGRKFDGFYDEWDTPLSEQQIQAEYGGGEFRIVVQGPHPDDPRKWKHYESLRVQLAGDPKWERQPRALRQGDTNATEAAAGNPAPLPAPAAPESPKVVESALKLMADTVTAEREERRRIEDRAQQGHGRGEDPYVKHAIDAERRRADEVSKVERERREEERRRREEEREQERRDREEMRREMDSMRHRPTPSIGEELSKLAQAGIFRNDDGGVAKEMLSQILERHRGEMEALHRQHGAFVESIRSAHETQLSALREAHLKEMAAEREASRAREDRVNERLVAEREERRRDRETYRSQVEERDKQWRDRMENQKEMLEQTHQSRYTSTVTTFEQRLQWKDQEIDRMRTENHDLKMKQEEKGDIFTQLAQIGQLKEAVKGIADVPPPSSSPSGGIGLTGASGDSVPEWVKTLAESPVAERLVSGLVGGAAGGGGAAPVAPQQQHHEGQILQTPQGEMVVVRDPASGQLAMAPRQALEARWRASNQQQQSAAQRSGLLGPAPTRRRSRKRSPDVVPNLAEGLDKPIAPWDAPSDTPAPAPESARKSSQVPVVTPAPTVNESEPMKLSNVERQVLGVIATHVHESVVQVGEPEDFVKLMLEKYPRAIVEQVVKGYTTEDIIRGVIQVQPSGAGATPAGRHFMQHAIRMLRAAIQSHHAGGGW